MSTYGNGNLDGIIAVKVATVDFILLVEWIPFFA